MRTESTVSTDVIAPGGAADIFITGEAGEELTALSVVALSSAGAIVPNENIRLKLAGDDGVIWPRTRSGNDNSGACAALVCGDGRQASALSDGFHGLRLDSNGKLQITLTLSANASAGIAETMIAARTT